MNPTNTQLLYAIANSSAQPALIDTVNDSTMYVGYCLPTTTGETDKTWLIKRISTTGRIQSITFPDGKQTYSQAWADRESLNYKYSEEC